MKEYSNLLKYHFFLIFAIILSASEEDLRPLVKLVGNMHGNEPTGRELLIHLSKYIILADRYRHRRTEIKDPKLKRAAQILKHTDLWILPTMNPDG